MAAAFVKSVQDKVGPTASQEIILKSLEKLPARSIQINKVVAAVRKELARKPRSRSRQSAKTVVTSSARGPKAAPRAAARRKPAGSPKAAQPKTMMEKLEAILDANWRRAEKEGLRPERMSGPEFVRAVHRHCDPRDATRSRIVRACLKIDTQDILIVPPMVADQIRAES